VEGRWIVIGLSFLAVGDWHRSLGGSAYHYLPRPWSRTYACGEERADALGFVARNLRELDREGQPHCATCRRIYWRMLDAETAEAGRSLAADER
jgi:hypothetical protein